MISCFNLGQGVKHFLRGMKESLIDYGRLHHLRDTISGIDYSGFKNKDTDHLNPKKHWCVPILAKSSRIWKSTST